MYISYVIIIFRGEQLDMRHSGRFRRALSSLKLRLALKGAVVIAISVAATALLVLRDVEQRTERAILDSELGHSERLARVVSARLVAMQLALRAGSAQLPIDKLQDVDAMAAFLSSRRILADLFQSLSVIDAKGRIVALSDAAGVHAPELSVTDRAFFIKTKAAGRPIVSDPIVSRVSGEATIVLSMPVRGPQGDIVAMLGGGLRLSERTLMGDLTQTGSAENDPVTTIIADATGRIISHPDKAWILRDARTDPRLSDAVAKWIAQGSPIEPQGSATRIGDYMVAMAGVPDADWVIFRTAPAEVLLGGPAAGRRHALWLSAGVAIVGGLVILLATVLMLRPLHDLERRALRLLRDDLVAEEDWPHLRGEIGELSKVFQHVMRQRALSQKTREELLVRMQAVMGNAPVGITFSRDRRLDLVSEHFARLFGYDVGALVGKSARVLYASDEVYQAVGARIDAAFAAGQGFNEEVEFMRSDGSCFWGHFQATMVRIGDPSAGLISITSDITEARQHRQRLSWTASHDPLTDLVSRREFEAQLSDQLGRRRSGEITSALFIDLDRFKQINDTAGHAAGDAMLKDVANILTQRVRDTDTVARLGGDEFAVLLRGCDAGTATGVAEQIRDRVEAHRLEWHGLTLQVGASIGVVCIDDSHGDAAGVMSAADAACYEAKRSGRNAVRTHVATGRDHVEALAS